MMQHFHTDQILEKLSPRTRERHSTLQCDIFNLLKQIIDDAIDAGEFACEGSNSADITFGLCSMAQGAQAIRSYHLPLDAMTAHLLPYSIEVVFSSIIPIELGNFSSLYGAV